MNQLTKSSSGEEIKKYFSAILKLAKASDEYPVNLDEVWPLVYGRKQEAVRALTSEASEFIENVDYKAVRQNAQGSNLPQLIITSLSHVLSSLSLVRLEPSLMSIEKFSINQLKRQSKLNQLR